MDVLKRTCEAVEKILETANELSDNSVTPESDNSVAPESDNSVTPESDNSVASELVAA